VIVDSKTRESKGNAEESEGNAEESEGHRSELKGEGRPPMPGDASSSYEQPPEGT
jgi:hypothetical protein